MAELDYAFLAEFVRLDQGGTWSALGAGFTSVRCPDLPSRQPISIAGQAILGSEEDSASVRFTISGPDSTFRIVMDTLAIYDGPEAEAGSGDRAVTFVAQGVIPLAVEGQYTVLVQVGDGPSRKLGFDVTVVDPAPGGES